MDLSVITVTWNSAEYIAHQIQSVSLAGAGIKCEQIIVDNSSADGTVALVKSQFPKVRLIENNENKGFAVANNQAARLAKGEFILFLNPDMKLSAGSLDKFVAWMRVRTDVGIAGCKLVKADGSFNEEAGPRRFPGLADQLALIFKLPHVFPSVLSRYQMHKFDHNREQEVDSVRGSCLLMRREVIDRLGWAFDPRYLVWFEDVDICREAKQLGYKVVYTPVIAAIDLLGRSFEQGAHQWRQRQFTKSLLAYFKKWEPWYVWVWLWIFRPVGIFLVWLKDLVRL